jgi:putative ABC transport system permease protein
MFRNYLTVALRNLQRDKLYAFINVVGLTIAVTFSVLAFLFVHQEWTFDAFHVNADRIYRVYAASPENISDSSPSKLAPALEAEYQGAVATRFHLGSAKLSLANRTLRERVAPLWIVLSSRHLPSPQFRAALSYPNSNYIRLS